MTVGSQFSLCIAGGDERGSPAHPAQRGSGFETQFPGVLDDPIGHCVGLEMPPTGIGWSSTLERRQAFGRDAPTGAGDGVAPQRGSVAARAVPEDQKLAGEGALEGAEKPHPLCGPLLAKAATPPLGQGFPPPVSHLPGDSQPTGYLRGPQPLVKQSGRFEAPPLPLNMITRADPARSMAGAQTNVTLLTLVSLRCPPPSPGGAPSWSNC